MSGLGVYGTGIGGAPIGEFEIGVSPIGYSAPVPLPQTDIRIVWDVANARGDWQLSGADLLRGNDLATSVLVSLFSDRQCDLSDAIPDGSDNRRGWWGDPTLGSRLWLLERSKLTTDIAKRAKNYAEEALRWLVDDGVVAKVTVEAEVAARVPGRLLLGVVLYRNDGQRTALNFVWVWRGV